MVKSESIANSLLTLRALGWGWGEGWRKSDTLPAKVKGKNPTFLRQDGGTLEKNQITKADYLVVPEVMWLSRD